MHVSSPDPGAMGLTVRSLGWYWLLGFGISLVAYGLLAAFGMHLSPEMQRSFMAMAAVLMLPALAVGLLSRSGWEILSPLVTFTVATLVSMALADRSGWDEGLLPAFLRILLYLWPLIIAAFVVGKLVQCKVRGDWP